MRSPLVSIIIPVYNSSDFLQGCIASVVKQTYQNIEVILVDDASTDASPKICADWAKKDPRIKLIKQAHAGVSSARNTALKHAKGDFITFVDSDDSADGTLIETLVDNINNYQADISICNYHAAGKTTHAQGSPKLLSLTSKEALEDMFYGTHFSSSPWCKLYTRALLDAVSFPAERICAEDLDFNYHAFKKAAKVVFSTASLYFYHNNANGITHSNNYKKRQDALDVAEQIVKDATYDEDVLDAAYARLFYEAIQTLSDTSLASASKNQKKRLKTIIKNTRKELLFQKKARKKLRAAAWLSYLGVGTLASLIKARSKLRRRKP